MSIDVREEGRAGEPGSARKLDAIVHALLEATESIHAALLGEGDLDGLAPAYALREGVFEELRAAVDGGARPGAAARATLERVRTLDQEILALGGAQAGAIRDEQHALRRRRSVIQAHAARERSAPRVIAVKA